MSEPPSESTGVGSLRQLAGEPLDGLCIGKMVQSR